MSSHHIVRESQEPALLIFQPDHLGSAHIGPLLEWSPSIVVMEPALQITAQSGIKTDVIVFPKEKAAEVNEEAQNLAPVMLVPVKEQEDPLLKALQYLAGKRQQAVNILLKSVAENENLLKVLAEQQFIANVVLLDDKEKWALCRSGNFSKWYPAREKTGVLPVNEGASLHTKGFTGDLADEKVKGQKTFTTLRSGTITILSTTSFWVIEQLY